MGGASRNEKRRRQDAANRRLASAGIRVPEQPKNRTPLVVVAVVVIVAVLVGAGILYFRSRSTTGDIPSYTASASGAVVTAGNGKVVIDTYEDFICPICERFEERYSAELTAALNAGQITVRYHTIAILDANSTPNGYSTRAANAAICAAAAGIYPAYRAKLFADQPAEGSAGLSDATLVKDGTDLGAKGDFAGCVTGATHASEVAAETRKAETNKALLDEQGRFGTPTVAIGGRRVDVNDTNWIKNAIAAG